MGVGGSEMHFENTEETLRKASGNIFQDLVKAQA